MIQLFIAHAEPDAACAVQLQHDLEAKGLHIWQLAEYLYPGSVAYPRAIENALIGSAALVVIWSANAATSEWVEREILFAQRLRKAIFVLQIDPTDLPITLINIQTIADAPPCVGAADQLLPHLLALMGNNALTALGSQLAHEHIGERRKGIQQAAELLKSGKHREEVLVLLEYIAHNDLMQGIRDLAAQSALAANSAAKARQGKPLLGANESRHIIGANCSNGHITYFDKRRICPASSKFKRTLIQRGGAELDELSVKCGECSEEMVIHVDCEGYK
jgi:hypothetical protein